MAKYLRKALGTRDQLFFIRANHEKRFFVQLKVLFQSSLLSGQFSCQAI